MGKADSMMNFKTVVFYLLIAAMSVHILPADNAHAVMAEQNQSSQAEENIFEEEELLCGSDEYNDLQDISSLHVSTLYFYQSPVLPVSVRPPQLSI